MTLTLWGNAQMENDGVSNIVTFEPRTRPQYAVRVEAELDLPLRVLSCASTPQ